MRASRIKTAEQAAVEYVADDCTQPLDLPQLFVAPGPLEVDLGCGDGSFIAALAAEHPERNFLGIERLVGRVRSACRRIAARRLTNARVLRVEIGPAVNCLIPRASVEVCHVMFPDPWPKRRHHRRRTITPDFLQALHGMLVSGGVLRLTTDAAPYFEQMQAAAEAVPGFLTVPAAAEEPSPRSTFETRFAERGVPIHRLVLRKVSPER